MNDLAVALAGGMDAGLGRRVGTVTETSPLTVETATGSLVATARLDSYTPVMGHVVLLLVDSKGAAIVAGRLRAA
jgi:hypothetical protein